MTRKNFFIAVTAAALFILSALVAAAQTGPLRGHVTFQQKDGTKVPAADATIDIYRIDIKGTWSTKADKKGDFHYAALPFVGNYVVAASMPGAQPGYVRDVNVKQDTEYPILLGPGDGSRLSLDEIKKHMSGGGAGAAPVAKNETAEEKAKREDYESKKKQNERNASINEIVGRTFTAGNVALTAKPPNYEEAIKQYQEGLVADPEQGALCTQLAIAFRLRGAGRYNVAIKLTDEAERKTGLDAAFKDFTDSADSARKAVELVNKEEVPADAAAKALQVQRKLRALIERMYSMTLFVVKVDHSPAQVDSALVSYHEYIDAEPDPVKKSQTQMAAGQMLMDAQAGDKAFLEYKKLLEQKPDDPDLNLNAGLALYSLNDKTKFQEAANYLQHFVDLAPNSHPFKSGAVEVLQNLKSTENVTPEKITPKGRRRP